jgi:hypothetical protein
MLSFDQFVNTHHITEEVEEDKGLHQVEEENMDPHLVEEEEEDKDLCLSHPTILTIPLLSQILLLVQPPTMLLLPMTTKMEFTAMVLPPMIQADDPEHLAVLWMLLVEFVCLILPMD